MKFLFASFAVVFATTILAIHGGSEDWEAYKKTHGKNYSPNSPVDASRLQIYQKTKAQITAHNSNPSRTFDLGHNNFSDQTAQEKQAYLGVGWMPWRAVLRSAVNLTAAVDRQALPATLDNRNDSCLAPVKNQGSCGSCWAFSSIAPLEFSNCKKYNNATVLSEQQLVDCDPFDSGCNGGWYTNAWYYLQNVAKGSAKQSLYAYTAKKAAKCKFSTSMNGAKVSIYGYVQPDATDMQDAVQTYGVISVAIAVVNSFFSYSTGVYTDTTCTAKPINHAVNVVGWGTLNGINYWVVRNSWGTGWGQSGYILMKRGVNMCQIETYPAYVAA